MTFGQYAVVLVVAIALGVGIVQYGRSASRQVSTSTHPWGRKQMGSQLRFTAPVDPATLCECIVQRVNAQVSAPVVAPGLYVAQRSGTSVVFAWGSLMSTSMRARVVTRAAHTGSTGSFDVLNWKESGANVMGSAAVGPLMERIRSAVSDAGGSTSEQ